MDTIGILAIILTIIATGAGVVAILKADMTRFETRMEKIDDRWCALFERFHILDKDIGKLSSNKNP